jgi:hypothetical protein
MALTVALIVLDPYFASASTPHAGPDATAYMFSNLSGRLLQMVYLDI